MTFHAVPPLDGKIDITVGNLKPPTVGLQLGVVEVALMGDVNSSAVFEGSMFPRYGSHVVFSVMFTADAPTVVVELPLAGAFEGLPIFLQAAIYQDHGTGFEVVACSRGTFFGIAAKNQ